MIVQINKKEKEAFEMVSELVSIPVKFYTHEDNENLLSMEIEDISHSTLFYFVRMTETQIEINTTVNKYSKTF